MEKCNRDRIQNYLGKLKKLMRLSNETEVLGLIGTFTEVLAKAPIADINIFGISKERDIRFMREISDKVNTSAIFLKDSHQENAIA